MIPHKQSYTYNRIVARRLKDRFIYTTRPSLVFAERRHTRYGLVQREDIAERDSRIEHVEQRDFCKENAVILKIFQVKSSKL